MPFPYQYFSFLFYVSFVPLYAACLMCPRALRAYVLYVFTCLRAFLPKCLHFLRAFIFYVPYCLQFFTCHTCLHFFTYLTCLCLVPSFFTCLHLFLYMLIKLTQTNEITHDCSSFLFMNLVIYQCLPSIFTSIKLLPNFALIFFS